MEYLLAPYKYRFSFTAASLRLLELNKLAKYVVENQVKDIGTIKDKGQFIGHDNERTSHREFRELQIRLEQLTEQQLVLLAEGDKNTQLQMAFLSVCKAYLFIRDFTVEVLRDKFLLFDYEIRKADYQAFCRKKAEIHPELANLTEITTNKVRQVTFKVLEQATLIDDIKSRFLQPPFIMEEVAEAVILDNPEWLKIFLLSDGDIADWQKRIQNP